MALFGKPKKEKIKSVKSDLDSDFETFDDDPFAEIEANSSPDLNPSKRNPVINVVQGVSEGIVQSATSGAVLRDKIEKSLPPGASYVFDTVDKTATGVRKIYDDSVKELRPHVKDLTKKIDKLVPANAQSLKKLSSKVAGFFDDGASNYNGPSKEEMEDATITGALNSVFQAQAQADMAVRAEDQARDSIKEAIDKKRHDTNLKVSLTSGRDLARIATYTDTINQAWQKKILELQYRQLFVQTDTFKNLEKYNEIFRVQLEAVAKNTALPEFVKIQESERFKEVIRDKFMDTITSMGMLSGTTRFIENALSKVKNKVSGKVSEASNMMSLVNTGLEGVLTQMDMEKSMDESGMTGGPRGVSGLLASMGGSAITEWVMDKAAEVIKEGIEKDDKKTAKILKFIRNFIDPNSAIRDLEHNEQITDFAETDVTGPKGIASRALKKILSFFKVDDSVDMTIKQYTGSATELAAPGIFDNRTHRTINEVIPELLSKINSAVTYSAMSLSSDPKDKKKISEALEAGHLKYDFKIGGFKDTAQIEKDFKEKVIDYQKGKAYRDPVEQVAREMLPGIYDAYSDEDKTKVRNAIFSKMFATNESVSLQGLSRDKAFADYGEIGKTLNASIKQMLDSDATTFSQDKQTKISTIVQKAKKDTVNPATLVQNLTRDYGKEMVARLGLAKLDRQSGYLDIDPIFATKSMYSHAAAIVEGPEGEADGMFSTDRHGMSFKTEKDDILDRKNKAAILSIVTNLAGKSKIKTGLSMLAGNSPISDELKDMLENLTVEQRIKVATEFDREEKINKTEETLKAIIEANKPSDVSKKTNIRDISKPTSDVSKKTNIKDFSNTGLLDSLKKLKVSSWNYKSSTEAYSKAGGTNTKIGPMAQDINAIFGKEASDGKTIDLTTLNGINMGAIKELDAKIDVLSNRSAEISILERMSIYLKHLVTYNKMLVHQAAPSAELSSIRLRSMGVTIDSTKYSSILRGIGGASLDLGGKVVQDLWNGSAKVIQFGKKNVFDPTVQGLQKGYELAKDPAIKAFMWGRDKLTSAARTVLDIAKDATTDKLPRLINATKNGLVGVKDFVVRNFIMTDLYVRDQAGKLKLALDAKMMQAGEYYDEKSRKVIKSIKDIKGNIVDKTGKIIVHFHEFARSGFFDEYGKTVKGFVSKSWTNLKKVTNRLAQGISDVLSNGMDMFSGAFGKDGIVAKALNTVGSIFGGVLGLGWNKKIYNVLLDIRDIIRNKTDFTSQRSDKDEADTEKSDKAFKISKRLAKRELLKVANKAKKKLKEVTEAGKEYAATTSTKTNGFIDKLKEGPTITEPPKTDEEWAKFEKDLKAGYSVAIPLSSISDKDHKLRILKVIKASTGKMPTVVNETIVVKNTTALGKLAEKASKYTDVSGMAANAANSLFVKAKTLVSGKNVITKAPIGIDDWADVRNKLTNGYGIDIKISDFNSRDSRKAFEKLVLDITKKKLNAKDGYYLMEGTSKTQGIASAKDVAERIGLASSSVAASIAAFFNKDPKEASGKLGIFGNIKNLFKRKRNDADGDGKADGSVDEVLENKEKIKQSWFSRGKKDPANAKEDKKDGSKGVLMSIVGAVGAIMGTMSKIVGSLPIIGKLWNIAGLAGTVTKALAKGAFAIGKPLLKGVAMAGAGVLKAGAMAAGAFALANPITAGVLAAGAIGTIVYLKFGKDIRRWINRDERLKAIRFSQYGFTDNGQDRQEYFSRLIDLEVYLLDQKIIIENDKVVIKKDSIDTSKVLKMMGVDERSNEEVNNFAAWFHKRFKPFFLAHVAAARSIGIEQFDKVGEQTPENRDKFLNLIMMSDGPYDVLVSPFATKTVLENTKEHTKSLIEVARVYYNGLNKGISGRLARFFGMDKELNDAEKKAKQNATKVGPRGKTYSQNVEDTKKAAMNYGTRVNAVLDAAEALEAVAEDSNAENEQAYGIFSMGEKSQVSASMKQSLVMAKGKLFNPGEGAAFIKGPGPITGQWFTRLHPMFQQMLLGMAAEYGSITGKSIKLNMGYRSYEEQEKLFIASGRNTKKVAPPGKSMHNFGLAVDMSSRDADILEKMGLFRKYGLTRPVGKEPHHVEPAGIQSAIFNIKDYARTNPGLIDKLVQESFGRGGGGLGSMPGARPGRDAQVARAAFATTGAKEVEPTAELADTIVANQNSTIAQAGNIKNPVKTPMGIGGALTPSQMEQFTTPAHTGNKTGGGEKLNNTQQNNLKIIQKVAAEMGKNPVQMGAMAMIESSLGANLKSGVSSASGIAQITDATRRGIAQDPAMRKRLGELGVNIDTMTAEDHESNLKAAMVLKEDDVKRFKAKFPGVNITPEIEYVLHNLGQSDATKFMTQYYNGNTNKPVSTVLSAKVIEGNPGLYKAGNKIVTIGEAYSNISNLLSKHSTTVASYMGNTMQVPAGRTVSEREIADEKAKRNSEATTMMAATAPAPGMVTKVSMSTKPASTGQADNTGASSQFSAMVDTLVDSNKVHHKQLQAAVETIALLEAILKNASPQALEEVAKAREKSRPKEAPQKRSSPVVNMSRTMT